MTDFSEQLHRVALEGRWSAEEILHALPRVLFAALSGDDLQALAAEEPAVRRLLTTFLERVGPADSKESFEEKVRAHYEAHPVDSLLERSLERCFRTLVASAPEPARGTQRLLGGPTRSATQAPPRGPVVRAGPMARFSAAALACDRE